MSDWESFKKCYYGKENLIQTELQNLTRSHADISKKLSILEFGTYFLIFSEADEFEQKKKIQQLDLA
jgi:hypothetical protein